MISRMNIDILGNSKEDFLAALKEIEEYLGDCKGTVSGYTCGENCPADIGASWEMTFKTKKEVE